jgi:4-hydroxy-2-oxoglutarate aldolase
MMKGLEGIFAPVTTPFDEKGRVNYEHLIYNVKKYSKTRVHGFLILGSNGENKSLTTREKEDVVKTVITHKAAGQTAMVASIFESTMETIEFAVFAQEAGADFITLLAPSYFKSAMKDAVLLEYFTDAASALKIPCLLYKAPQFSGGLDLSVSLINECAKHPNIKGIKDSSSGGIEKILHNVPEDFTVLAGSANTFMASMLGGARGGVLSLANYFPEKAVELYGLITAGDLTKAAALNREIVNCNIDISGSYGVAGVKRAMDAAGFFGDFPRRPLLPLSPGAAADIKRSLEGYGALS